MKVKALIISAFAKIALSQSEDAFLITQIQDYLSNGDFNFAIAQDRMQVTFLELIVQKYDEMGFLPESLKTDSNSMGFRAGNSLCPGGNCMVSMGLQQIWGYGCWCNFDENLTEGGGTPVNTFDEICRDYTLCLRCAKYDGKVSDYGCDPKTQDYAVQHEGIQGLNCTLSNPDDICAQSVCSCEQTLLSDLIALIFLPASQRDDYTDEFLHANGFDRFGSCNIGLGGSHPIDVTAPARDSPKDKNSCCGEYPRRFPFSESNRLCCDERSLYNPISQQCCGDSVIDSGEVC